MSTNSSFVDAYSALRREFGLIASSELKRLRIGQKQMLILFYLSEHDTATATDLADFTLSDPAAITRGLQALERLKWVKRKSDPLDNRKSLIELTEKGRRKSSEVLVVRSNISELVAKALPKEELEHATRLLKKIVESLLTTRKLEVENGSRKGK